MASTVATDLFGLDYWGKPYMVPLGWAMDVSVCDEVAHVHIASDPRHGMADISLSFKNNRTLFIRCAVESWELRLDPQYQVHNPPTEVTMDMNVGPTAEELRIMELEDQLSDLLSVIEAACAADPDLDAAVREIVGG